MFKLFELKLSKLYCLIILFKCQPILILVTVYTGLQIKMLHIWMGFLSEMLSIINFTIKLVYSWLQVLCMLTKNSAVFPWFWKISFQRSSCSLPVPHQLQTLEIYSSSNRECLLGHYGNQQVPFEVMGVAGANCIYTINTIKHVLFN